ncbi:MAG: peptide transporter [Flavobacteriaceae bacterium]|nr:peptide transporter [Flavobacteriaceae bacterium]
MHLNIHSKQPGFEVLMIELPSKITTKQTKFNRFFFGNKYPDKQIPIQSYYYKNKKLFFNGYESENGDNLQELIGFDYSSTPKIIMKKYYLGTDKFGRDVLSRIILGSRISFFIGFVAVFISLIIGMTLGSIAGYYGGKIDLIIMWFINVTWSIPTLLLVIAITLALGKGFWQVFIAVGLTMWVEVARVVRGEVLKIKELQYITAAKTLGFNDFRIISKHIIPNIIAPIIVISAANFAAAILIESGLSFLGIGAQPPICTWGGMVKSNFNDIILGRPHLALIPGICIMMLVMSFMFIGNAVRDAMDVRN